MYNFCIYMCLEFASPNEAPSVNTANLEKI